MAKVSINVDVDAVIAGMTAEQLEEIAREKRGVDENEAGFERCKSAMLKCIDAMVKKPERSYTLAELSKKDVESVRSFVQSFTALYSRND